MQGMVAQAVGRYRLLRKLANGNMGEVFLAEYSGEAGFRRRVVVKRLFSHLGVHPEAVRMFQDEAHVLSCLSHPNIPQVYDLGCAEGHWFLVIEHVPGHTLAELCTAGARAGLAMPIDATVSVIEQLCDALHHAHERCDDDGRPMRIVHRDVTPHNLMLTPDGFAKLLDFGVARTNREESKGGAIKGTLAYMAPEQVRGQRLDKRSDVFSIGVILYELTTGRRLYFGSEVEVMTSIVERDVPLPSAWVPGYPPDLEKIVLTALSRDRGRRWPSAAHLSYALEEYVASLGMVATHQSLARYYQHAFSSGERVARGSGSYQPVGSSPPRPSAPSPHGGSEVKGDAHRSAGPADLRSLRSPPPSTDRQLAEAPHALHLPGPDDLIPDETPLVLSRPKK